MEYKILYRIEHPDHFGGAWYNEDGSSNRIVDQLTSKRLAELPMEYDPRYHADGKKWFCAAHNFDNLLFWFTPQDAKELVAKGFKIAKFISKEYILEEHQVNFTKEDVVKIKYYSSYEELLNCREDFSSHMLHNRRV